MEKHRNYSFELSAAAGCGLAFVLFRNFLFARADSLFAAVFGKSLSGRGQAVHMAVLGLMWLVCVLGLSAFDRLIFRRLRSEKVRNTAVMLPLALPAVQTVILCANQILRRDDYWEIADAHSYGFPGSAWFEITNHNGRYLSWTLKSLYAVFDPIPYNTILMVLNAALLVLGLSMLVYRSFGLSAVPGGKQQAVITGTLAAGTVILLSSNVWEVWFWGSGMMVYGLSISLCILGTALVLGLSAEEHPGKRLLISAGVVCFLACGGSELSTASLAAFLFILLLWKRFAEGKWDRRILFYFAEVCACSLFILLISGSVHAAGEFADAGQAQSGSFLPRLPAMIGTAVDTLWRYTFINYPTLLVLLFCFLMLGAQFRFGREARRKILIVSLLLIFTAHPVLLLNVFLDYMPPRVVTIPLCWILAALSLLCMCAGSLLGERLHLSGTGLPAVLLFCLCTAVFFTENIGELRAIREAWMIRDASLSESFDRGETLTTCSLPSIGSGQDDLSEDPAELFNIAMRMYYRVTAVTAPERCEYYKEPAGTR